MHKLILAIAALGAAGNAFGHHANEQGAGGFQAFLLLSIAAGALLYARGVRALWRRAGPGRGIRLRDVTCFALGWVALAAALLTPLDTLAERSFALHMIQHELLMVVAAPLIALGRPLEAWAWAVPSGLTRRVAAFVRTSPVRSALWLLAAPASAWIVHAVALWVWHVPMLFKAALASLPLHVLQHTCFFVSALGFWWAVTGGNRRMPAASSIAALFVTMLHTSALGALLTFAPSAWYAGADAPALGLSALEDQQLGGLVMWVPGGLAYLIAGLAVVRVWLESPTSVTAPAAAASARARAAASLPGTQPPGCRPYEVASGHGDDGEHDDLLHHGPPMARVRR
jgi:cytochrome c oxidase assembly factor CtaG